ncbi:AraC family transcriptional regulator [Priestia endophytica]|jgi:AraC-like DNA-binding protein|uniref:AraC family transcriptional regulator n=1 Tax=Priestia endophytica TaxID=135735 RepID=UPI000F54114B|nr:AraC family transcriptional regulator [Priestia endophytica]RPK09306.1 hypothetical protein FH5_04169 [Priestia endophytica]
MFEHVYKQNDELVKIIKRYSKKDGVYQTAIPALFFINESHITEPLHVVYKPAFCVIVQGEKEVLLAQERFKYGPADYLISSVDLPVTGQVIKASSHAPYLALKLEFTSNQILEVLNSCKNQVLHRKDPKRALFVSQTEPSLLDAVTRLVRLLDSPEDIPTLAPLFMKEILYKILKGQHGATLEQIAIEGSDTYKIRDVIEHIIHNYDAPLRIQDLAERANMSVSSFHRHFKEITAMSPIQFQKQLRLQEARRLLLAESSDAGEVAFRVGYESPSQFSREYSRMFGFPPREDIKRIREKSAQKINV